MMAYPRDVALNSPPSLMQLINEQQLTDTELKGRKVFVCEDRENSMRGGGVGEGSEGGEGGERPCPTSR